MGHDSFAPAYFVNSVSSVPAAFSPPSLPPSLPSPPLPLPFPPLPSPPLSCRLVFSRNREVPSPSCDAVSDADSGSSALKIESVPACVAAVVVVVTDRSGDAIPAWRVPRWLRGERPPAGRSARVFVLDDGVRQRQVAYRTSVCVRLISVARRVGQ